MRLALSALLLALPILGQSEPPVSMDRFLAQQFYPKDKGRFTVDKLYIIFPPAKQTKDKVTLPMAARW